MSLIVCFFVWVDALRPRSTVEVMSGRLSLIEKYSYMYISMFVYM